MGAERRGTRVLRKKQESFMRGHRKQLKKEGWLRQFVADEAQARDAVEIYGLLGYEVHLQPPNRRHFKKPVSRVEESQPGCRTVYIRPKKFHGRRER